MNRTRKRQKVNTACQRCRQRKLGCDATRPCVHCLRADVECIPRLIDTQQQHSSTTSTHAESLANDAGSRPSVDATAVLPESSIVDLSTMIFSKMSRDRGMDHDTSALPGGHKIAHSQHLRGRHWRQIVEWQLPPDDVLEKLVDQFFASVNWFMMVFHERSFRQMYANLVASEQVSYHEENFLWLSMLVVGLGTHYSSISPSAEQTDLELQQLSRTLLTSIELRYLQIIGCSTLEAVQICLLLGSFHLFNGRPSAALGILGSGVKIAQIIGLHRESMWRDVSSVAREARRRTWWALEVFDKYAAIAFGRPCSIDDSDCDVAMVSEPGAETEPLLLYHQWKFRLYRIMGPFLGRRLQTNRLENVSSIHRQLSQWREELPAALRIETQETTSERVSLLEMQALSLQLTYDNLQIILHRSAAFHMTDDAKNTEITGITNPFSHQQLFESAMRTSELYKYSHALQECRRTHANMHIGITLFTAGVVLCAICLCQPMSEVSQKAKTGIMRIIRLCQDNSSAQHLVSVQCLKILEGLVAAVLQLENQVITGRSTGSVATMETQRGRSEGRSERTEATSLGPIAIGSHTVHGLGRRHDRALDPLQEVFVRHVRRSFPPRDSQEDLPTSDGGVGQQEPQDSELAPNQVVDPAMGFDWNGDLSLLMDSGLGDASQLWLWADSLNFDSFAE